MITLKHDLDKIRRQLGAYGKQVPFATAKSLTELGKKTSGELTRELQSVFERPTPYITKSPYSTPATKANLKTQVGIRDQSSRGASPYQYIKEELNGGVRGLKPYEIVMRKFGVLPAGWRAVPGEGMKLDAFGNPNRGQLHEVLGSLRSGAKVFTGKGKRQSLQGYFVVLPGALNVRVAHLEPGIWRRIQRGKDSVLMPVFIFVQLARYQQHLSLEQIADRVIKRELNAVFAANWKRATETAR